MSLTLPTRFVSGGLPPPDICALDLADYSYNGINKLITGYIVCIDFSPDGKYAYWGAKIDRTLYTATMSPNWDITTWASGLNERFTIPTEAPHYGSDVWGIAVTDHPDGTAGGMVWNAGKYFLANARLSCYTLNVPYQVFQAPTYVTPVFYGAFDIFSPTGSRQHEPRISPDGLSMISIGQDSLQYLYQFTMTSPFDITTMSYVGKTALPSGCAADSMFIPPSGSCVFLFHTASGEIRNYPLTTAWDSSTLFTTASSALDISAYMTRIELLYVNESSLWVGAFSATRDARPLYQFDI